MIKYTIPTYTYLKDEVLNTEKQFATKYDFICCDALYNKYNAAVTGGIIWDKEWSNQAEHNPVFTIDAFLEYPIFSNSINTYVLHKPNSPNPGDPNIEVRERLSMYDSMMSYIRGNLTRLIVDTNDYTYFPSRVSLVNGEELVNDNPKITIGNWVGNSPNYDLNADSMSEKDIQCYKVNFGSPVYRAIVDIPVYPEDILVDNEINEDYLNDADFHYVSLRAYFEFEATGIDNNTKVASCKNFKVGHNTSSTLLSDFGFIDRFYGVDLTGSLINSDEEDDPYSELEESDTGGGDGTMNPISIDSVDPAVIPSLPSISVTDLGLITMYNPTAAQIKSLADFLWSGVFDPATFKKLFSDPMQALIGLAIVPVTPTAAGSANIMVGSVDSGVSAIKCASNWVQLDCGSVDIEKFVGNFMDADPYTEIQIYLPFIGIRKLSADDINGGSIHVVYNIDILTGACACFIAHNTRGVLYTYNGSCITNVPLTSQNFSGAIQNAVSAVISGIGVAAGAATGAAPITAMGAMGILNSAANAALNSKPQIQRSGNLGGSAGILSILKPYVIIERPSISVPAGLNSYVGNTCNITYPLGVLSGFTMVEYIHIEDCPGTTEEVAEIESLLHQGVYL